MANFNIDTDYKSEQFQKLIIYQNNSMQIIEQMEKMEVDAKLKEAYKNGKTHADIKNSFK